MIRYRIGWLTAWLLWLALDAHGQRSALTLLDVSNGLPSSEIYAAHVDREGYTWISTKEGLCRWDGRDVQSFLPNPADSTSVLSVRCYSILESNAGKLYVSSVHGLSSFESGRQAFSNILPGGSRTAEPFRGTHTVSLVNEHTFITRDESAIHLGSIRTGQRTQVQGITANASVLSDGKGQVWFVDQGFFVTCNVATGATQRRTIKGLPSPLTQEWIVADDDGAYAWLVHGDVIYRLDLENSTVVGSARWSDGLHQAPVVATSSRGGLVLVTPNGSVSITKADRRGSVVTQVVTGLIEPSRLLRTPRYGSREVRSARNGNVLLGGYGALLRVDVERGRVDVVEVAGTSASDVVLPVDRDSAGRTTALIVDRGVVVIDPLKPIIHDVPQAIDIASAIMVREDVVVLFAGATVPGSRSLALRIEPNRTSVVPSLLEAANAMSGIRSSLRTRDGAMWLGMNGRVVRYDGATGSARTYQLDGANTTSAPESNLASRLIELPDGRVWILTDRGRYEYDEAADRCVFRSPVADFTDLDINDAVVGVVNGTNRSIWAFGHRQIGMLRSNGTIDPLAIRPADATTEPPASIKCMMVDDRGRAFIADRRSVIEVDLATKTYRRLRSPFVRVGREPYVAASVDHIGNIWLVTPHQIERFDPRTGRFRIVPLDTDVSSTIHSAVFPRYGNTIKVVLLRSDGVGIFDPATSPDVRRDLQLHLTTLHVHDRPVGLQRWLNALDTLTVNYGDSPFAIGFGVVDPTYGTYVRFRYLLEGYDEHWVELPSVQMARYQQVGPGTYRFRVQVFDVDGTWKEPRAPLTVIIEPTWWQTIWLKLGVALAMIALGVVFYRSRVRSIKRKNRQLEQIVEERTRDLRSEQERSEKLLLNVLPASVAHRLKAGERQIADSFSNATVLFADLVGFTPLTSTLEPHEVVRILNDLFSRFDRAAQRFGVERIKTIGDGYMAAAGLPEPAQDHARRMALFALDMISIIKTFSAESAYDLHLRIGINSGDVVAAVVGESRFAYDVWGDTVNVAARMESLADADSILCTTSFVDALAPYRGEFRIVESGLTDVKGKGAMHTYGLFPIITVEQ